MTEPPAYINGEWPPHAEAKISIFDSAVMLGDCVTESTRTFARVPFRLEAHLARLPAEERRELLAGESWWSARASN